MGNAHEAVAVRTPQGKIMRLAQPRRTLADGVEHALEVDRRMADDLEYICGCRLLLQQLGRIPLYSASSRVRWSSCFCSSAAEEC